MKKRSIHIVACLILLSNICAPATAEQTPYLSTPVSSFLTRIGVGVALEYNIVDVRLKVTPASSLASTGDTGSVGSQTGRRFQLSPSIEFGAIIENDYYLGIFVSWRYSAIKNSVRSPLIYPYYLVHEFQLKQYTDILLKPGYRFTPRIMFYGLFGPSIANWSHTSRQYNGVNILTNKFAINKTSVGLGLGFGFEYLIKKKYALSLEYTYHLHRSVTQTQNTTLRIFNPPVVRTGGILKAVDPSYSTIAARFTYFFNL
jgi:opacity protein-like surface antigen